MNCFCGSTDWENLVPFNNLEIETLLNCNVMCINSVVRLIEILRSPSYLFRTTRDTIYKTLYLIERLKRFHSLAYNGVGVLLDEVKSTTTNQNTRDIALKLKETTSQNPISRELRDQYLLELSAFLAVLQNNMAEMRSSFLAAADGETLPIQCTAHMNSDGKLKQSVVDELVKLGVNCYGVRFEESKATFIISATGMLDESEFQNQLSQVESLQGLNISYHQNIGIVSDDAMHSGGVLEYSSLSATIFDGIDLPFRNIFDYFDEFGKPDLMNNSTVGCILKILNKPYLLTAAHCLFNLSLRDEKSEMDKRKKLNRKVKFAIYHRRIDACLFPCLSSTFSPSLILGARKMPFNLGSYSEWTPNEELKGFTVFKIGYKTGITFGTFEEVVETVDVGGNRYKDVVKVKSNSVRPFTDAGDSGAIYFLIDDDNEIRPIAIHRASDKETFSYGSILSDCISDLLKKMGLQPNVDVRMV